MSMMYVIVTRVTFKPFLEAILFAPISTNVKPTPVMSMLIVPILPVDLVVHVNLVIQVVVLLALISTNVKMAPTTVIEMQTVQTPMATLVVPVELVIQVMV